MTRKVANVPVKELSVCLTNADQNRVPIDRIVIHTMVGTEAGANARFNDCNSHVSAHYGVCLDGSVVHWVDEDWVSYGAGNYPMNQRCINIEHEDGWSGPPEPEPTRPDVLYSSSAILVADICKFYGIPCDRQHILKHTEVSDKPTSCPDALDIDRIVRQASAIISPPPAPQPPVGNPVTGDQTLIDFGNPIGVMELQAARSKLIDSGNSVAQLSKENAQLRVDNANLTIQVNNLQTQLANLKASFKNLSFWDKFHLLFG